MQILSWASFPCQDLSLAGKGEGLISANEGENYIILHNKLIKRGYRAGAVRLKEGRRTIVEPDISVICDPGRLADCSCIGAPDWIIENVSPGDPSYDYIFKLNLYADAGVREYWIVDSGKRRIFVCFLERIKFKVETYTFRDRIQTGIYEDFRIDFTELAL